MAYKTLTTSYQLIKESYVGDAGGNVYIRLYAKYSTQEISNNRSYVYYQARVYYSGSHFYDQSSAYYVEGTGLNKVSGSKSDAYGNGETTLCTTDGWITHDTDGTKTVWARADLNLPNWGIGNNVNDFMILPTIPRYATSVQSLNSKTETTIKINWSSNSTIDYIWYSINNGSSYTAIGSVNATSGSYTISGLSANTTYNIKTKVRRKDSQQPTESSALSVTTYQYPYVKSVSTKNLTIGNGQDIVIYNPLGRTVTVYMKKDNTSGTTLYSGNFSTKTEGISFAFTPTSSTLYNSIPNSQSGNCVYYCVYSNQIVQTVAGTYKIIGTEKPNFTAFAYEDTNTTTVALTENNQILVNNYSLPKFTVTSGNKAYSNYGATISKYIAYWGNASKDMAYSSSANTSTTLNTGGSGNIVKVTAIDSRGLSTTKEYTITNIPYVNPILNSLSTQRKDGIDTITYLEAKITLWKGTWDNSSKQNDLINVAYRTRPKNGEWTNYKNITTLFKEKARKYENSYNNTITYTLSFDNDLEIHANTENGGFAIGTEYDVAIQFLDGYGNNYVYPLNTGTNVTDGKIAEGMFKDENGDYFFGWNGMPKPEFNFDFDGNMRVQDKLIVSNVENKNLFDVGDRKDYNTVKFKETFFSKDTITYTCQQTTTGGSFPTILKNPIKISKNTNVTVSLTFNKSNENTKCGIYFYQTASLSGLVAYSDFKNAGFNEFTFNTGNNEALYVGIYITGAYNINEIVSLKNIQIELGTLATSYTPYKKYGYNSFESMGNIVVDDIRSDNLFNLYDITCYDNLVFDNGVFKQIKADNYSIINFVVQLRQNNTTVQQILSINLTSPQKLSVSFTKNSTFNSIRLGLNGSTRNTLLTYSTTNLENGKKYTLSLDVTNITQGSISWTNMQIEEGDIFTSYNQNINLHNEFSYLSLNDIVKNSWISNGVSYAIKQNRVVTLTISIRYGTSTSFMSLPENYRPTDPLLVLASNGINVGYVQINSNGECTIISSNIFTSGSSNLVFNTSYLTL